MKIFIDIETVFTRSGAIQLKIAENITPPGNIKKAESIAKWEEEKKPEAIKEAVSKTALSALYGEITCICFAIDDGEVMAVSRRVDQPESMMLNHFWRRLFDLTGDKQLIQWIGFNVMFDYEFLRIRSIINNAQPPIPMSVIKPWDKSIFDVKEAFVGNSVPVSSLRNNLSNTAAILGLGEKHNGISGAEAPQMWLNEEYDELIKYCKQDVELTREMYKRINFIRKIEPDDKRNPFKAA